MTTLYVTVPGSQLVDRHGCFYLVYPQQQLELLPVSECDRIVLFGNCRIHRKTERAIASHRISILLLDRLGNLLGRTDWPDESPPAKYSACQQSRLSAQPPQPPQPPLTKGGQRGGSSDTAESIVRAKLHNQRTVLLRHCRFYVSPTVASAMEILALLAEDLSNVLTIEQLGDRAATADRVYAQALVELLWWGGNGCKSDRLLWQRLGNTLLREAIYDLVRNTGLDPHLGISMGNKVLADDLPLVADFAAELAPLFADSLAVTFSNTSMHYGNGNSASHLANSAIENIAPPSGQSKRQTPHPNYAIASFIANWERQWDTEIIHPRVGTLTYRQCLEFQVREYLAFVLGDLDCYRPMLAIERTVPESRSGGHGSAVSLQSKPMAAPKTYRTTPYIADWCVTARNNTLPVVLINA